MMTRRVVPYGDGMGRWDPDTRERLERAALALFTEQGFVETTVPQITARAGLTTRTFFRHFADKREVLFAFEGDLPGRVEALVAAAPPDLPPMVLIGHGLRTVAATLLEDQRAHLWERRAVIRTDAGLQERELRKAAVLTDAIADGLRSRGFDELVCVLAAHSAASVLGVALERWLREDTGRPLADLVEETLDALRSLT